MPKQAKTPENVAIERRYFDLDEANSLIPWLNLSFATIFKLRTRIDHCPIGEKNFLWAEIEDLLNEMTQEGLEIADVEMGVVNFYTRNEDEEVIFSWQYGESGIRFWHEPFEDFCHRRPLKHMTAAAFGEGPIIH